MMHLKEKLIEMQKKIYLKEVKRANWLLENQEKFLVKYTKEFYKDLPQSFSKIQLDELEREINSSQLILFGDFHTLKSSQQTFKQLVITFKKNNPNKKIIFALEAFLSKKQIHIDNFLEGKIKEKDLLKNTDYDETWGFAWENYREIMNFAKNEEMRVIGINEQVTAKSSLKERDERIAKNLVKLMQSFPDSQIFCLIGENHLSDSHLPLCLKRLSKGNQMPFCRVLCNIDNYYFSSHYLESLPKEKYLKLDENFFCIINTPPWLKWMSYTLWEDTSRKVKSKKTFENHAKTNLHVLEEIDFDSEHFFLELIGYFVEFFSISMPKSEQTNFDIFLRENINASLFRKKKITLKEKNILLKRLKYDGYYYTENHNSILLDQVTINHLAYGAGDFIFRNRNKTFLVDRESVWKEYRTILQSCFAMLCTKLFNPICEKLSPVSSEIEKIKIFDDKLTDYFETIELGHAIALNLYDKFMNGDDLFLKRISICFFSQKPISIKKMFIELMDLVGHEFKVAS